MKKNYFVITGISNLQDMMPLIVESAKNIEYSTGVIIFDNLKTKRQFQNYEMNNVIRFIKESVNNNHGSVKEIKVFGKNDIKNYHDWYSKNSPDHIFLQNLNHKTQYWKPTYNRSKIILLSWHMDSTSDLIKHQEKVSLNIVRHENELIFYSVDPPKWMNLSVEQAKIISKNRTKFFGNIRKCSLQHKYNKKTADLIKSLQGKKVCFIAESHIRARDKEYFDKSLPSLGEYLEKLFGLLKEFNYYIVWKKREKGYPKEDHSPLEFCNKKPDLVIEKDLNYPSVLFSIPAISRLNLILNTSNSIFDVKEINDNSIMLINPYPTRRETSRLEDWFGDRNYKVLDMTLQKNWITLKKILSKNSDSLILSDNQTPENIFKQIMLSL